MKKLKELFAPLSVTLIIAFVWDFLVRSQFVDAYILPSPLTILEVFVDSKQEIINAVISTSVNSLVGFLASCILGYFLAIFLSTSQFLTKGILPIAVFFQTMPIIAVAPLLVIWFGFGDPTVRVASFIVSFFPVLSSSLTGLNKVSSEQLELFRSLQATKFEILFKLRIPDSLQFYFSGMKVSAGLAVIGAIVGEFIAGGGLGGLIDVARTQQRVDIVIASLLCSGIIGFAMMQIIRILEIILLLKRPYFTSTISK